jgi:hypothetical protein
VLPDGRFYIGGHFESYNGTNRSTTERNSPETSISPWDGTFQPVDFRRVGVNYVAASRPTAIVFQRDGRLFVGGDFHRISGAPRQGLVRLLPDGSLDGGFDLAAGLPVGADGSVHALMLDERERIVIAGPLARALAGPCCPVARLRPDGTLDTTFHMNESDLDYWRQPEQLPLTDDRDIVVAGQYFGPYRLNGDAYPKLSLERQPGGAGWRLTCPTLTGDRYLLEATVDFQTWTPLESRPATGCELEFLVPEEAPRRFYRVERRPAP